MWMRSKAWGWLRSSAKHQLRGLFADYSNDLVGVLAFQEADRHSWFFKALGIHYQLQGQYLGTSLLQTGLSEVQTEFSLTGSAYWKVDPENTASIRMSETICGEGTATLYEGLWIYTVQWGD